MHEIQLLALNQHIFCILLEIRYFTLLMRPQILITVILALNLHNSTQIEIVALLHKLHFPTNNNNVVCYTSMLQLTHI